MCVAPCATFRSRTVAKRFRYGVQVSGRKNRNSDYPPSLASAELMFGKRDDTSDRVRLRTMEDRAANTKCAPRMSHSVFRHRLVAMLCSYNNSLQHLLHLSHYKREKMFFSNGARSRTIAPQSSFLFTSLLFSSLVAVTHKASTTNTVRPPQRPLFQKPVCGHKSSNEPSGSSQIHNIVSYRS